MDLLFLGTGAGLPSTRRNVTAIALRLLEENGSFWLFDCGEATQHQIMRAPARLNKLTKIWITHLHGDHLFGLPGLLGSRSFHAARTPLQIFGPKGIHTFIEAALKVSRTHLTYPIECHEIEEGIVYEDNQFLVETRMLVHGMESWGYRIVEKDTPGMLDAPRLRAEGISPGPLYGDLKRGLTVSLPDGRILHGPDYLSAPARGRVVTILGDTRPCQAGIDLAKHADVLVHEATYAHSDSGLALAHHHSTAREAAEVAAAADCRALILTHVSARYQEKGDTTLLEDAKTMFQQTWVAHDFFNFPIARHTPGAP